MIPYCEPRHVTDLILRQVAEAAEALNGDLVSRTISDVTEEVASHISARYQRFSDPVPAIIRWATSVIAAWRVVGAITSLMDTESSTDNQWLPIQTQYKRAWDFLDDLATGRKKLPAGDGTDPDRETAHFSVVSPGSYYDLSKF